VVGFTKISAGVEPIHVVRMLNQLYTVMDYCASLFPLYKVETIGDAYMVVGGLPHPDADHAQHVADFAVLVRSAVAVVQSPLDGSPLRIRIGIHSGPVMAGVVGNLMPRYCLFGDTVNTASRMESNGEAGRIQCSHETAMLLMRQGLHSLTRRGVIDVKGKGQMTTYWLNSGTSKNHYSNADAVEKMKTMAGRLMKQAGGGVMPSYDEFRVPDLLRSLSSLSLSEIADGAASAEPQPPDRLTILVVEDSVSQRKMLMRSLHQANKAWEVSVEFLYACALIL
jgi:class 3 adenylate cyclase